MAGDMVRVRKLRVGVLGRAEERGAIPWVQVAERSLGDGESWRSGTE